jgi:hypothetical protein
MAIQQFNLNSLLTGKNMPVSQQNAVQDFSKNGLVQVPDGWSGQPTAVLPAMTERQTTPIPPSPEEIAAARAAANARASFAQGRQNIMGSIQQAGQNYAGGEKFTLQDIISGLQGKQQGITESQIGAQQARNIGTQNILGMIGRGVQSGATLLANRNALDSSAAGAIARAYGQLGQRQQSGVNTQYQTAERQNQAAQNALEQAKAQTIERKKYEYSQQAQTIAEDAAKQMQALNEAAAGAGISDRINIDAEKQNVRNQAIASLAELDRQLGSVSNVQGASQEQIMQQAQQRQVAGQAPANMYDMSTITPEQQMSQQPGSQIGQLPIYSTRRRGQ